MGDFLPLFLQYTLCKGIKTPKIYIFLNFFPIIPMGAVRYSSPIRLVPTYILPAKDIRLLGKFQPDRFKT